MFSYWNINSARNKAENLVKIVDENMIFFAERNQTKLSHQTSFS